MSCFIKKKQSFVRLNRGIVCICYLAVTMAIFSAMVTACVRDVTMDALEEPTVVVECVLTDDPVQTLYLTYTKGASRDQAPELPEATAILTDLTEGMEAGHFAKAADGTWQLSYAAIPEHSYRLDVSIPGHDPIWAEQTMPGVPGVSVGWHQWDPNIDNNIGYSFRLSRLQNPMWFYGINYPTPDSAGEQTPYLCTNSPAVDSFNVKVGSEFREESGDNFLYGDHRTAALRATCYPSLTGLPQYDRCLRFSAENYSGGEFFISGAFRSYISDPKDFVHAQIRPAELHYFSASEEYDLFLRQTYKLIGIKSSASLADIFVRENVFSNMNGEAIGILGAKVERGLEWDGRDTWYKNGYFLLARFASIYHDQYGQFHHNNQFNILQHSGFLDFKLLHFEYCIGDPGGSLPDWAPEWDDGSYSVEVIRSESELEEKGLESCGPVDFSNKVVLYCAFKTTLFPCLIGYGYVPRRIIDPNLNERVPIVGFVSYPIVGNKDINACRFAILVDDYDSFGSVIHNNGYGWVYLPVTDAEVVRNMVNNLFLY